MRQVKALVLLSGGLDSMLSVKVLQAQGTEVEALCFVSNFFNAGKAEVSVEKLGIKIHIIDFSQEILNLAKNPVHGYGKNMNPCIDCHGLMFKMAGKFAKENNFDFVATGEVLGQRPFSQNKQSLKKVEKIGGIEILRPLSAKLLPETLAEKKGLIKRNKLLNIEGRGRERQMELAKKLGIEDYPTPAGGCLLTDPDFSQRLKKMLDHWPNCDNNDIELLKYGRVYWIHTRQILNERRKTKETNDFLWILVVVGRHKEDNEKLEKLVKKDDIVVELKKMNGPLTIVRILNFEFKNLNQFQISNYPPASQARALRAGKFQIPNNLSEIDLSGSKTVEEIIKCACLLTGWHAVKARGRKVNFDLRFKN
jgi:tRNA U34 2-thiouridine synthase MnmA/TrmU